MPSSAATSASKFFTYDQLAELATSLTGEVPVIRGKVWAGEERSQGWTVECASFEDLRDALRRLVAGRIEFLAFDESLLDDDALHVLQEDLYRYADEQGVGDDLVSKAVAALRSHENELFAVLGYAFLTSGHVLYVRVQSELAKFVYHPDRLLSSEGLARVRKLKTLIEQ